jgi:hypothetical protein
VAKVKNISGEPRIVPALGGRMVLPGQEVEVAEDVVYAFTCQTSTRAPVGSEAQAAHDEGDEQYRERLEDEVGPEAVVILDPPAGNASRDTWAEWAVAAGLATPDDVADLSRDDIRTTYGPQEG